MSRRVLASAVAVLCAAIGAVGWSTAAVAAVPPAPCTTTAPAAPSNLRPLASYPTAVILRWTIVVPEGGCSPTGFDILRAPGTSGAFARIGQTGSIDTFADNGVSPGTSYRYQVLARSAYGLVSGPSNTVWIMTPGACTPTLPMGSLTVRGVTASSVSLAWVGPTNPACLAYDILRVPTTVTGGFTIVGTTTGLSFTDSGLPSGATYRYVVRGRILPTGAVWGSTNMALATTAAG